MWPRVVSAEGINYELRPWLRMTMPRGLGGAGIDDVPLGQPLGRSWLLLLGLLPVDYDDLCLVERETGRRFLERSSMLSMRLWQHERSVESAPGRTSLVTDRLDFELRRPLALVPGSERLAAAVIGALFRHRHRRLGRYFAAP